MKPFAPGVEVYRGFGFQVFQYKERDVGTGGAPGQWNANMYDAGWWEPMAYGFEPLDTEDEMRSYIKGELDKLADQREERLKALVGPVEEMREQYRQSQEESKLSREEFRETCKRFLPCEPEEATPLQWVAAAHRVYMLRIPSAPVTWGMHTKRGFYTGD